MSKKILICEDDSGISELIRIILEENGFKTKITANGKGIQKIVKEFAPNLILLDLWLPGMDGKEIVKLLKKDPITKNISIIIVSALNDVEKQVQNSGVDGFIAKPFDINDFLMIVKKHT